jgi:hypothetical protein
VVTPSPEAYLYSLEPELFPSDDLVSQAIFVSGLFSPQVCLTDAQVFVTEGVKSFFRRNEHALLDMLEDPEEVPLICIALRENGNIEKSLDLRLEPKGEKGFPTYDNSLLPSQNAELRNGYNRLKSAEKRREKFFKVAGKEARRHVDRLAGYIERAPSKTSLARSGQSHEQLYESTKTEISQLLNSPNAIIQDQDRRIADAILSRIDKHPKSSVQTREILHWATYGRQSPPVYRGEVDWSGFPGAPDPIKNEWRFLLNSIYNHNLAKKLNLRPVLNSGWWRIGLRWLDQENLRQKLALEPAGILPLSAPLYRNCLNIDVVRQIRKNPIFWVGLAELEEARRTQDSKSWLSKYKAHLQFLSEQLAKYLVDIGRRELVGKSVREMLVSPLKVGGFIAGPVVTLIASLCGLPSDSAMEYGRRAIEGGETFAFSVDALFRMAPGAIGG